MRNYPPSIPNSFALYRSVGWLIPRSSAALGRLHPVRSRAIRISWRSSSRTAALRSGRSEMGRPRISNTGPVSPPPGDPLPLHTASGTRRGNLGARRQQGTSLHQVAKLADVSPPLVGGDRRQGVHRQEHLALPVLPAIMGQEVLREERNIVATFPRGGTWIRITLRR